MKEIDILIIMECLNCGKDIKRQMELWNYKSDMFCSKECKEVKEEEDIGSCKICNKKTNLISNTIYYDGDFFCSQKCYLEELRIRNIMKNDPGRIFSFSDDEEEDQDVKDLFNMEITCKYCNKYMNKSDKETIIQFGQNYCSIECYRAKFHIVSPTPSSNSPVSATDSPPYSHSFKNWTFKNNWTSDNRSSNALIRWSNIFNTTKTHEDPIKDSKREKL